MVEGDRENGGERWLDRRKVGSRLWTAVLLLLIFSCWHLLSSLCAYAARGVLSLSGNRKHALLKTTIQQAAAQPNEGSGGGGSITGHCKQHPQVAAPSPSSSRSQRDFTRSSTPPPALLGSSKACLVGENPTCSVPALRNARVYGGNTAAVHKY